ncbi:MAG: hypothetical protein WCP45_15920, partial [Verrucomicrobiota bacterium]
MKPTYNRLSRLGQIALATLTLSAGHGFAASNTWTANINGNWGDGTKWQSLSYPNGLGEIATFGGATPITAARTITLDLAKTVGGLTFNNAGSCGITLPSTAVEGAGVGFTLDLGTKNLTLDTGTAGYNAADLVVIDLPTTNLTGNWITSTGGGRLVLVDNVELRGNSTTNEGALGGKLAHYRDNRLVFQLGAGGTSGALSGAGNLNKTGPNQLAINGDSGTYSGTIRIAQGLTQASSNSVGGTTGNNSFGTGTVVLTNGLSTTNLIGGVCQDLNYAQLGMNSFANNSGTGDPIFAPALTLEATSTTRDFSINPINMSFTWAGNISSAAALPVNLNIFTAGRSAGRVTLTGDNSGLSFATGKSILAAEYLGVGNANALGLGNNQPVLVKGLGYMQSGVLATIPTTITSVISVESGSDCSAAILGATITSGTATFSTGGLALNSSNATQIRNILIQSATGGTVVFNNILSSPVRGTAVYKTGGGLVEFNGNNSYYGLSGVRSGTLVLGHNNALGLSTSTVTLGQATVHVTDVKAASIGATAGAFATTNGGTFTGAATTLDGVALVAGDRVLVKDDNNDPGSSGVIDHNGIYTVVTSGTWQRTADLNTSAQMLYGLQVSVTNGNNNAGKVFFLTTGTPGTANTLNTNLMNFVVGDIINPATSLLLKNGITLARNLSVVANGSSGKSTLGGNGNGSSTFSGTVALARDLTVTAASGGSATFS